MKRLSPLFFLLILVACAPRTVGQVAPTVIAFPTMTPGYQVSGSLPTPLPQEALLANPATAVALASQPTPTPNYGACPQATDDTSFVPAEGLSLANGIPAYLNAGGTVGGLRNGLLATDLLPESGTVTTAHDLTGEGAPEVLVALVDPVQGGTLLLLTCENGRYVTRYQSALGDGPPQVLRVTDLNADGTPDLLATAETCSEVDGLCEYRTTIVTWDAVRGRFINLLNTPPDGDVPPRVGDVDNDRVAEVITVQEGRGSEETGPLRTGSQIYDWDGTAYQLSVSQPDPLRYMIQIVHEADRAFREERPDDAARLYLAALDNDDLAFWFGGNERAQLETYVRYRLLLTYTFAENGDALTVYEEIRSEYPGLENAPVYAALADAFWNAYQTSNNLNIGCAAALDVLSERPLALDVLNRYGTRNPTYTADQICPY